MKFLSITRRSLSGQSARLCPLWLAFVVVCLYPAPSQAQTISGTYVLTPTNIDTGFSVRVLGRGPVRGEFTRVTGKMVLDQNRPEKSKVNVKVDLRTVQTDNPRVTGFLKSPAMFDVARHPVAMFRSTRVHITGEDSAEIEGNLSLRGQNKRTRLRVRVTGTSTKGKVDFEVSGGFFRSLYGMEAGLPIYADKVNLIITGSGRRQ